MTLRIDGVASDAVAITPSDTTELNLVGFYVGTTGNVSVITQGGDNSTPVIFNSVPAGTIIPLLIRRVRSTGTTASNIRGFIA